MEGLTEGRIVHYSKTGLDHCLAAIVVRVWDKGGSTGTANLRFFRDGSNDRGLPGDAWPGGSEWATSAAHSADLGEHVWHWPQECPRGA